MKKITRKFITWFDGLSGQGRIILIGGIIFMFLLLGISFNLLTLSEKEVALLELRASFYSSASCHEECLLSREKLEKIIVSKLKSSSRLDSMIQSYLSSPAEKLNFKKKLIQLLVLADGSDKQPAYLSDYLHDPLGDPVLKLVILTAFDNQGVTDRTIRTELKNQIVSNDVSSAQQLAALNALSSINDGSLADYYVSLLTNSQPAIRQRALVALSNVRAKKKYFSLAQLESIRKIINNTRSDNYLRQSLLLLLSDYYPLFPTKTKAILSAVYDSFPADPISRAFAADFLNGIEGTSTLAQPKISQSDWQKYYNN